MNVLSVSVYSCWRLFIYEKSITTIMNKTDLINEVAFKMGVPRYQSLKFINTFQVVLADAMKEDNAIALQGFGTFSPWKQTERVGRNPRKGTACIIPPRTSVKFKPGKLLLHTLNSEPDK